MYRILGADGREYSAASADQLRDWIAQRRADGHTRVLPPNGTEWVTLAALPEFAGALAAAAATPGAPAKPPPLEDPEKLAAAIVRRDYRVCAGSCLGRGWDLLMANFWAICGNWWFGAIGHDHAPRPQFHVLEAWRSFTSGQLLPVTLDSPVMATGKAGFVPAFDDTPQVSALAIDQGADGVRLMVLNRHPTSAAALRLKFDGVAHGRAQVRTLSSEHYFGKPVRWSERAIDVVDGRSDLLLGQHALAFVHLPRR